MHSVLMMGAGASGLPRTGLVLAYDFFRQYATTGAAQTLTDFSGRGNTGTLGASTNVGADDPDFGVTALTFGGDDFVQTNSASLGVSQGAHTILVVVQATVDARNIVGTGAAAAGDALLQIVLSGGKPRVKAHSFYTGATNSALGSTDLTVDSYYLLGQRVTATKIQAILSGVVDAESALSGTPATASTNLILGSFSKTTLTNAYTKSIALVALWNRSLADAEMLRAYRYIKSLMAPRGIAL